MNPQSQYYNSSIRNSYGYQEQASYRNLEQQKQYNNFNTSLQDNKIANPIKIMQSRVDGIQAMIKYKRNIQNQPIKNNFNSSFQHNQPNKFQNNLNNFNSSFQNNFDQKPPQLRGSCPNIFKKLDQSANNLRSTTKFINLNKFNISAAQINKKQLQNNINSNDQIHQNNQIQRNMKKTQQSFINNEPNNFKNNQSSNNFRPFIQGQGNNQKISKQNFDKQTIKHEQFDSPVKLNQNRIPNKISTYFANQFAKKTPQTSIKANTTPSTPQMDLKKFNSLNQIWQNKQKQKTNKKIAESIKTNSINRSKMLNGFQIGKVLGKGKFGQVFLARHQNTGFVAAIKKIEKSKVKEYKMIQQFSKQIKLHSALDHPNIVKFFGFFQQNQNIYLVMQYMNGGTLFDYLNQVYHLGIKQTIQFLRDIIQAIIYLHEKSIAHRDIKPQNIVISSEGVAKLCDFGWSAVVQTSRKTYCGTFDYAPPQILQRKSYDMSVDVWCIGVLTYQLLTGRVPFEGQKRNQIMDKILNVDKLKFQYPVQVPQQAKDFIQLLVQKDPNLRPKPNQLLKHPFFSLCPSKAKSKKIQ